jgi:thiol-disulfide isomerase/thioredoxin/uncharacterized membrane protein YphA (DoxX/SURF4 family)
MTALVLLARLALAAVFLTSAVAKLADRNGSRQAVRDFGVPNPMAASVAAILPLLELVIAFALLPAVSAIWGAGAGVGLLAVFSAAIAVNLARGRRPDCHCFGQLSSEPIGWSTVLRNLALIAAGAFVIVAGREGGQINALAWLRTLSVAEVAMMALAAVALALSAIAVWLLLQLLGQHGRLLLRMEAIDGRLAALPGGNAGTFDYPPPDSRPQAGLAPGTRAPAFDLKGLYGERMTLDALRSAGKPVLLLFGDPNCGPCNALMPDVARWQRELAGTLTVSVISRGEVEANQAKRGEHGLTQVLLQEDWEVSNSFQAAGTPTAVLVRADGAIGSYVASGAEEIRALVSRQIGSQIPVIQPTVSGTPCPHCGQVHGGEQAAPPVQEGLAVGTPAPEVILPDLAGKQVSLNDFHGRETLVLFWNPGCGFCQQLLPQLKEWEQQRPEGAPEVVLISTGSVEANQEHGLRSTIVIDDGWTAGAAFGASGTPSAVLVDAEGKIAAPLGVGGPSVMALAKGGQTQ